MEKNLKKIVMHRQGDVLIERVDRLPDGEITVIPDKIIARGEVSGHNHYLVGEDTKLVSTKDGMYAIIGECATPSFLKHANTGLRHEFVDNPGPGDHLDIPLEPGIWKCTQQRVFDLVSRMAVKAVD